jgi:S-(hydroxymethyl)glutathione dehydrogenase/alcohol dehydrogenase
VLPAQQAIVVPKEIPFDRACLIGCGVMTGVGAALNIAEIAYGDTVMVIGCGAVGLSALQGAVMAGSGAVIAVDLDDRKLALAGRLGATHTVNAARQDPVEFARSVTRSSSAKPPRRYAPAARSSGSARSTSRTTSVFAGVR